MISQYPNKVTGPTTICENRI